MAKLHCISRTTLLHESFDFLDALVVKAVVLWTSRLAAHLGLTHFLKIMTKKSLCLCSRAEASILVSREALTGQMRLSLRAYA